MRIPLLAFPVASALLLSGTIACGKNDTPKLAVEQVSASTAGPAVPIAQAPQAAPGMMATGHAAAPAAAMPGPGGVSGTILETMDSGGYTYMRLRLADGSETWTAVNKSSVKKGESVTVVNAAPMDGFESKTLGRKFDRILFGQLAAPVAQAPVAGGPPPGANVADQLAAQHAGVSQAPDPGKVDVPKAEGKDAKRVAEVFAEKAQLADKSVTIRGKVVKFTPGVMGRNWIHLRDGSGSPEKKDNDVTVTSNDAAAIGDVVVVKGKVGVGRDFGMGYAYPVLIEEATVTK
jgi:hypothetical protein